MDGKLNISTNIRSLALGAALAVGAAGATHAATFTAVDDRSPATNVNFFSPETFSFSYDATEWASIDSATLFLSLADDKRDLFFPAEAAVTAAFGNNSASLFLTTPITSSFTWYELGSVLGQVAT